MTTQTLAQVINSTPPDFSDDRMLPGPGARRRTTRAKRGPEIRPQYWYVDDEGWLVRRYSANSLRARWYGFGGSFDEDLTRAHRLWRTDQNQKIVRAA